MIFLAMRASHKTHTHTHRISQQPGKFGRCRRSRAEPVRVLFYGCDLDDSWQINQQSLTIVVESSREILAALHRCQNSYLGLTDLHRLCQSIY
ncbi:hypothetical protein I7I48_01227 [Histoplasma ohiense]|nr:hypothetical protein I7I48_01227 [Histoplasma ohiense (nom. inval.)]